MQQRVTVPKLRAKRHSEEKIIALTAYDYTTAYFLDQAMVDIILVGDSLSTVVQGNETTLPVTLEEMIYHARCVARGVKRSLVVCDLPFMSYQQSVDQALTSAGRVMKESGVAAVKFEGGEEISSQVEAIVRAGIPVMGHLGLTPQSFHAMGGHLVQGKDEAAAERLLNDAVILEQAGVFSIVLEGIPSQLASLITERISIPTIGIGAGSGCSGQVLVVNDFLGMAVYPDKKPKFVKSYCNFSDQLLSAVKVFRQEVQSGEYPALEHSYKGNLETVSTRVN